MLVYSVLQLISYNTGLVPLNAQQSLRTVSIRRVQTLHGEQSGVEKLLFTPTVDSITFVIVTDAAAHLSLSRAKLLIPSMAYGLQLH